MRKLQSRTFDDAQTPIEQQARQTLEGLNMDADEWLDAKNTHFGGRTPRELLHDGDEEPIRDLLWAIRHGEAG